MVHKPGGGSDRVVVSFVVDVVEIVVVVGHFFLHTLQIRRISLNLPRMILFLSSVVLSELLVSLKSVTPCKLFPNNLSNTFWRSDIFFVSSFVICTFSCKPTVAGSTTRTLGSCEYKVFS